MESKGKILLPDKICQELQMIPEKGMGYQLVSFILQNGEILKDRIVLNSSYLKLNEKEDLKPENIKSIWRK